MSLCVVATFLLGVGVFCFNLKNNMHDAREPSMHGTYLQSLVALRRCSSAAPGMASAYMLQEFAKGLCLMPMREEGNVVVTSLGRFSGLSLW
jgi:hypothetical protein